MVDSMKGAMTDKRVNLYNPDNRKHYRVRPRKTRKGKKGHLISEWSPEQSFEAEGRQEGVPGHQRPLVT